MFHREEHPDFERVRFQLRASGNRDLTRNPLRGGVHTRGYLPHVKHEGADYFVTFRLADSLPRAVLMRYEMERAERLRLLDPASGEKGGLTKAREAIQREFHRKVERYLDKGAGACHLRHPEVADLVAGSIRFFNEERYVLREWVVMPNHVHVLFWPTPNHLVGNIVKSWKQYSSLRAKQNLGLGPGRFWQPEAFDHWVRDEKERSRIARYIRNNPVIAGLCVKPEDWRWSSAWRGGASTL